MRSHSAPSPRPALLCLCAATLLVVGGCASVPETPETRSFSSVRSQPGVEVEDRWTFYQVRGQNASDLARSLASEAPPHGEYRVYGLTRWEARWDYDLRRSSVDCRIVRPRVKLEIETVLPRWSERGEAGPLLRKRWKLFVEAVRHHETGHRQLVEEAGRGIVAKLDGLRDVSCALLDRRAEERARSVVDEYHHRNLAYDDRTRGGREQGVRWP